MQMFDMVKLYDDSAMRRLSGNVLSRREELLLVQTGVLLKVRAAISRMKRMYAYCLSQELFHTRQHAQTENGHVN